MLYNTENPHGGDIYEGNIVLDFSANVNPFGTPESVKQAVRSCADSLANYPDPYCRALISAISEREHFSADGILCGNGAAELIYAFALSEQPETAVELAPTFAEYTMPLRGTEIHRYTLQEENGFLLTDGLISFIGETRPDAVFLCNPNNPTGLCADPKLIRNAADICKALNARLFLDECFMDLTDAGESFTPFLPEYRNVVILKAFTKSFGMAGLRLGYCMSADTELLSRMARTMQPWNVSSVAQAAGVAAFKEADFLGQIRRFIRSERPRLAESLSECGLTVFDSDVNFLLVKGQPGLDEKLLEKGIKIRNCSNFYGLTEGFYRIAVKLPEQNERLIEALRTLMN